MLARQWPADLPLNCALAVEPELLPADPPTFQAEFFGWDGTAAYITIKQYKCARCKEVVSVHPYQVCHFFMNTAVCLSEQGL